ncbi:MAG: inositol monophosphatase [FCB group bacterium]|nr:inositol monophosphatase [FCB group bacterium]
MSLERSELAELFESAKEFAREAARVLIHRSENIAHVQFKGKTDLVTDVDRESEELLIKRIQDRYPDHGILAEESDEIKTASPFTWVIDPLDGTTNYVHGYPAWAVSVAITWKGTPVIGVVVELPMNRIYSAFSNGGAWCNDQTIHPANPVSLEQSLLVTGFGYEHGERWRKNMRLFKQLTDQSQGVRRLGSAAIDSCHCAAGFVDAYWELDINPWDIAAGVCIAREAGAIVSTPGSDEVSIYQGNILIAAPSIFAVLNRLIQGTLSPNPVST